jgi:hypothetical protein
MPEEIPTSITFDPGKICGEAEILALAGAYQKRHGMESEVF